MSKYDCFLVLKKAFFGRYFVIVLPLFSFDEFYRVASFDIRMRTIHSNFKNAINKTHDPKYDNHCSVRNVSYYKQ